MTLKSKPSSKILGYREELHSCMQSLVPNSKWTSVCCTGCQSTPQEKWGEHSIKEPALNIQRLNWEANLMLAKGKCQRELAGFSVIRLPSGNRAHSLSVTYVPS